MDTETSFLYGVDMARKAAIDPLLMKRMYDDGMTFGQIAEHFGCSFSAVRRRWLKEGFPKPPRGKRVGQHRTPVDLDRADELLATGLPMAEVAAILGISEGLLYNRRKEDGRERLKKGPRVPERNGSWRGGVSIDKSGYVMIRRTDGSGYDREHRLVMEQHLGRKLLPGEVVHHINGDRADNRIENLELFASNADHLRVTLAGKCPNWTPEGRARIARSRSVK